MPDLPAGGWVLRVPVPDGTFTLAVEADDVTAAAEHADFADRCEPLLLRSVSGDADEAVWLRAELIGQLDAMRKTVAASGLGYLGALAGEQHGRPVLILLGIAAISQVFPNGIDPASLLAAMLRHQYPGAAVEEFETAQAIGVGVRRCEETAIAAAVSVDGPATVITGTSQALVPFPEAGLLGTVVAFCFNPADIDVATVFTATIAHHLIVVPYSSTAVLEARAPASSASLRSAGPDRDPSPAARPPAHRSGGPRGEETPRTRCSGRGVEPGQTR